MIKKWDDFIRLNEENHQEFLDSLDTTKDKYFLVILLKGDSSDANQLSSQIFDFYKISNDLIKTSKPVIIYYSYDWIVKKKSSLEFRNLILEEAENLGISVKVMTHMISEYDFETNTDVPKRYRVDTPEIFKKLNTD